jgi:hypothetical protein
MLRRQGFRAPITAAASTTETIAALGIVGQVVAARCLLSADASRVYFLGRPIGSPCAVRVWLGVPCPMCGITRSLVLTVHGKIGVAWALFPAAPIALAGLALLVCAWAVLAWLTRRGASSLVQASRRALYVSMAVFGGATAVFWLVDWIARCQNA